MDGPNVVDNILTLPNILDILLKLGIVIFLIYLTTYLVKKFSILPNSHKFFPVSKNKEPINVVFSKPLNPNTTLHIVEIAGRVFLISSGGNQANFLTEFKDEEEVNTLINNKTAEKSENNTGHKFLDIIKKNKIT